MQVAIRSAVAVSALLAVLASGCGGDGENSARTVEGTTTAADDSVDAPATTAAGSSGDTRSDTPMTEVIVRLEDLPTGWTESPPDAEEATDDSFCEGHDPLNEVEPIEEDESNFQQGDFGPFVASLAGRYGDEATAASVLDQLAEAVDACQSFTEVDEDGTEVTYTFSALSFPDLGDDTYAARLGATTPFGPLAMDFAFTRVDDRVVAIVNGGLGAVDSELTEQLLRVMVERL